jgi:hypothetical protein
VSFIFFLGSCHHQAVAVLTFFTKESKQFENRKSENPIVAAMQVGTACSM